MIKKHLLSGNSGYSATLTGFALNTTDLEQQDLYKNGRLLAVDQYALEVVGSDTVITFVSALTIFDKIEIYEYVALTLSQLKRQLKIFHDTEDQVLRDIMEAAVAYVEDYSSIAMYSREITQMVDFENQRERVTYHKVTSVTSVKKYDPEDNSKTDVDFTHNDIYIHLVGDSDPEPAKYEIVYTVSGEHPVQLRRAALMVATDFHEERESGDGFMKIRTRNAAHRLMDQVRHQTF